MKFYQFRASGGAIERVERSGGLWVAPDTYMAAYAISDPFFHLTPFFFTFCEFSQNIGFPILGLLEPVGGRDSLVPAVIGFGREPVSICLNWVVVPELLIHRLSEWSHLPQSGEGFRLDCPIHEHLYLGLAGMGLSESLLKLAA